MKHQQLISETAVKTKAVIQTLQREIRCMYRWKRSTG